MTKKKDESPEEATNPYWSDELLAVLAEALGDEDRARQTLEGIIQQAQEGKAMQTLSTERLASYLTELYGRIAEGVQNSGVKKRRSIPAGHQAGWCRYHWRPQWHHSHHPRCASW